jgi:hypothetical protein
MNTIKLNTIGERPIKKSGASGGGGGNYVYFDTSSLTVDDERMQMLLQISYPVKEMMLDGLIVFSTNAMRADVADPIVAVGIDLNLKITAADGSGGLAPKPISLEEMITEYASWILDLPRLTEEEYYNPYIFFLEGSLYNFEEGMTWGEWVNSKYNTAGFVIDNDHILYKGGYVSSGNGSMRAYNTMVSDSYYVNYG